MFLLENKKKHKKKIFSVNSLNVYLEIQWTDSGMF